jgi:hypothetical protein
LARENVVIWFRALPLLWRLLTIAGVLAALGGALGGLYAHIRHTGYVDGFAVAAARCEADKRAQEAANRAAIDAAGRRLEDLKQQLQLKDLQLDDYLKALDLSADAGAGAGDLCLDDGGVRRLDAIR